MLLGTAITWATVGLLLFLVNPADGGIVTESILLIAICLGSTGLLTILGVVFRVFFRPKETLIVKQVRTSLRQGFTLSLLMVLGLILSSLRLFSWWNMALAIIVFSLIEYMFLSHETAHVSQDEYSAN